MEDPDGRTCVEAMGESESCLPPSDASRERTGRFKRAVRSVMVDLRGNVDFREALVSVGLFLVAFFVLSPRYRIRRKKWSDKASHQSVCTNTGGGVPSMLSTKNAPEVSQQDEGLSSGRTSTASNSTTTLGLGQFTGLDEDDNVEEQFEKNWQTIRVSSYRRVVLPPECKLLDKHNRNSMRRSTKRSPLPEDKDILDHDDNPAQRLQQYSQHVLYLIRSLLYYDYVAAGKTVIEWLEIWIRLRNLKGPRASVAAEEDGDDDDDDDDDEEDDDENDGDLDNDVAVGGVSGDSVSMDGRADKTTEKIDAEVDKDGCGDKFRKSRNGGKPNKEDLRASETGVTEVKIGVVDAKDNGRVGDAMDDDTDHDTLEQTMHSPLSTTLSPRFTGKGTDATPESTTQHLKGDPTSSPRHGRAGIGIPRPPRAAQRATSEKMTFFDAAPSQETLNKLQVDVPVPDK